MSFNCENPRLMKGMYQPYYDTVGLLEPLYHEQPVVVMSSHARKRKCEISDCMRLGFLLFGKLGYVGRNSEALFGDDCGDVIRRESCTCPGKGTCGPHSSLGLHSSKVFDSKGKHQ